MSRRLSQHAIRKVVEQMNNEPNPQTPEAALAAHQEALKPKRPPIQNDFMKSPDRWLGVKGHPTGMRKP